MTCCNRSLIVDLYELTMGACYARYQPDTAATFELFVRALPANRSYLVAAGLEDALQFLQDLRFEKEDIAFLRARGLIPEDFLKKLARIRFTGDVWAIPEGTVFFPDEPLIRVTAPIIEAQLAESFLLAALHLQTMIASKAARVVQAAKGRPVYDFSLRRTHGPDASVQVARAAYIAGCAGTSNVLAAKRYAIPPSGTMAHSFVLAFGDELESFKAYAATFQERTTLLVDTYDTRSGVTNAIEVGRWLQRRGKRLRAVRLDSGDIVALSRATRSMLDKAGLSDVKIIASGNLDEFAIEKLLKAGACVDSFGVGTQMGTSFDAPALDVIYKMTGISKGGKPFVPVMKLSAAKATLPGSKQVWRSSDSRRRFTGDRIGLDSERLSGEPLLSKVMRRGRIIGRLPSLEKIRQRAAAQIASLPEPLQSVRATQAARYPVTRSAALSTLARTLAAKLRRNA
jgi:nicotinate phosphoribosyltransferase